MEVVGTVSSVVQTLLASSQSLELKEFLSRSRYYKSELEDLHRSVNFIKAVFLDADQRQKDLSEVQKQLIQELKDVVYEADDLLDEFVTLAEQKQLLKADGTFSKKLSSFFSRNNPIVVANKMHNGVEEIKKKLNAITKNNQLNLGHNPEPIRKRRMETCSYVNEVEIIGRGEDLEKIVGVLHDPNVQQDLSFLSIFGIGGLGKTALAQLVFNDPRVKTTFPLRIWTGVSDEGQKPLDFNEVLEKILASATRSSRDGGSSFDLVQSKLQQELAGKRYLIVLDDVWTENRDQWSDLVQYFVGGQSGSWIVVTTRSQRTAMIVGDKPCQMHELQGLSEEDSWRLFEKIAFGSEAPDADLVTLGREIVDGCARVPLAIRVIGGLLYGQDKSKWQSFKEIGVSNIQKTEDGVMSILLLSYHHLESHVKSCFSYCALFPKDFEIHKEMLIDLWIAQGYVVPFYDGQDVENAGEEYFSILLKRCFFQDIERDGLGEIISCKMHDLIHDIAQSVSRKEIYVANTSSGNINEKVRHFSTPMWEYGAHALNRTCVRSYIQLGGGYKVENSFVKALISSGRRLRALSLVGLGMKSLSDSFSTLLHLRYLNLSYNYNLEVLPKSILRLYNLQTLILQECKNLKELPKNFSKLVKLRTLNILGCGKLKYMPRGMDKLTCLSRLSHFIVGSEGNFVSWKQWFDGLRDVKAPNGLKGELRVEIKWPKNADNNIVSEVKIGKGNILRSTEHLNSIIIEFEDKGRIDDEERRTALMEDLHPHPNLKILEIRYYEGTGMPDWAFILSNLVKLELCECEHIKEWRRGRDGSSSGRGNNKALPCLPQLKSLMIWNCPELRWIPLCPKLEILELGSFNKRLVFGPPSASFIEVGNSCPKLKGIEIDNVAWLNSLPIEAFHCLENLLINDDEEVEKLGEAEELFRSCSSSLQTLDIRHCPKLRSVVGGGLEHLTALEELIFYKCENLELSEEGKEGEDGGIISLPCPSLLPSLRTLQLQYLQKLENLPNWMQLLPALQTLKIEWCRKLKTMPNWMPKLTSLRHLYVSDCLKRLKRRCEKEPQGEDWPFIQHIPSILFHYCYHEETSQPSSQSFSSDSDI